MGGIKIYATLRKISSKLIVLCIIVISWATLSLNYFDNSLWRGWDLTTPNISRNMTYKTTEELTSLRYKDSSKFLIDTPGCKIPNFGQILRFKEAKIISKSCGTRAVFVEKISTQHFKVRIDENKFKMYSKGKEYTCCYQFIEPNDNSDYTKIRYTKCVPFQAGSILNLDKEMIAINCETLKPKKKIVYRDVYMVIKKYAKEKFAISKDSWNVLIIGMDTMSRARLLSSMPKTINYLQNHKWLDFRGYQKVASNTFPNVMAFMTGKNMSKVDQACKTGMDNCNNIMLWSRFKQAGYVTATGEDYLRLPDTFTRYNGFKQPPTDHYMRPFFLTGETEVGNHICTRYLSSAKHLLDYAQDLSKTYKNDNFFGMFWINSFSHNLHNVPTLIEPDLITFFEDLHVSGVLNKTFVFFLSDHGIRFGQKRVPYESYYDERLPMLYMWLPSKFRETRPRMYRNFLTNQNRLITPYDLYNTLLVILAMSRKKKFIVRTDACPKCVSLFNEISKHRSCEDVNVDEKWCSCRNLVAVKKEDPIVSKAIQVTVKEIQDRIKRIPTTSCMKCEMLQLKTILRVHKYSISRNKIVYIIAFTMKPGDVSYEINIELKDGEFNIINPTGTISEYNTRGNCVKIPVHREFCVCKKLPKCK